MAGLPKAGPASMLLVSLLLIVSIGAVAQDVQTPSVVIVPIPDAQTPSSPLEPVIVLIEGQTAATEEQQAALIDAFQSALDASALTVEEALEMLALVEWEGVLEPEAFDLRYTTLLTVLADTASGTVADPVSTLAATLNEALTPPGVLNALGKAGTGDVALARVSELVADGLPLGIIIRVTKDALRDNLSEEEILKLLDELERATAEDQSWGQAANEVTGQGEFKHQDTEQNENQGDNEEPEEEVNQHGSQGNNGKADEKAQDKDKKKG